jgi:hypothetical protein
MQFLIVGDAPAQDTPTVPPMMVRPSIIQPGPWHPDRPITGPPQRNGPGSLSSGVHLLPAGYRPRAPRQWPEGLAKRPMRELLSRQEPQFLMERRRKFVCSLRVRPLDSVQDACDITHTGPLRLQTSHGRILSNKAGNLKPEHSMQRWSLNEQHTDRL